MPKRLTARGIADDLAARIRAGEYAPGEQLEFDELKLLYGTSRSTIQRAMSLLYDRELAEYVPGRGAFVRAVEDHP